MRAVGNRSVKPVTMELLLERAAGLFRRKGYAETTTRELSAALGIQKASLYHHIDSKEDLLHLICLYAAKRLRAAADEALAKAPTASDHVPALIRAHVSTVLTHRDEHATALIELRSLLGAHREEIIGFRDAYEELVRGEIALAQKAGILRTDISAKNAGLLLLGMMNWPMFWFTPRGELSHEHVATMIVEVFARGSQTIESVPGAQAAMVE